MPSPLAEEASSPFYKASIKGRRARQRVNTHQGFHQRVEIRFLTFPLKVWPLPLDFPLD